MKTPKYYISQTQQQLLGEKDLKCLGMNLDLNFKG